MQPKTEWDLLLTHMPTRRSFIAKALAASVSLPTIAAFLNACGGQQTLAPSTATASMKLASASGPSYFQVIQAMKLADEAKTNSGGRLTVQVYPNAQLGGEVAALNGLQLGTIEGYVGGTASGTSILPELGVLDLPYLFDSDAHYFKVMDGSLGNTLQAELDAKDIHLLAWWAGGVRDVYNNRHAINEPADMKGLKLRIIQSPVYVATFKAFGAIPTPLAFGDVYLALKTGTLDGAETALTAAVSANQDQVVKYASLTHHQYTSAMLACSKTWWAGLAPDLQGALEKAVASVTPAERNADDAALQAAVTKMTGEGIDVVTPDRAAFRAIATGVWSQFAGQFGQDTINAIRNQATG